MKPLLAQSRIQKSLFYPGNNEYEFQLQNSKFLLTSKSNKTNLDALYLGACLFTWLVGCMQRFPDSHSPASPADLSQDQAIPGQTSHRAPLPFNSWPLKAGHPSTNCWISHILPNFKFWLIPLPTFILFCIKAKVNIKLIQFRKKYT